MDYISQAEYARRKNVTPARISQLVKVGVIKLVNKKVDPVQADAAIIADSSPNRDAYRKMYLPDRPVENAPLDYRTASTFEKAVKGKLLALKLKEREGKLVNAEDVMCELTKLFTDVKTRIRGIAPRCAQEVAHLKMSKGKAALSEIQKLIMKECDEALTELSQWKPTNP